MPATSETQKKGGNKRLNLTKQYKGIRKDLIDQLELNGTYGRFYEDLVDDYMRFWETKYHLLNDISNRGVTVEYKNGENQFGHKKNDSIEQVLKVNAQMLRILSELGIKPTQSSVGSDSDGDEKL